MPEGFHLQGKKSKPQPSVPPTFRYNVSPISEYVSGPVTAPAPAPTEPATTSIFFKAPPDSIETDFVRKKTTFKFVASVFLVAIGCAVMITEKHTTEQLPSDAKTENLRACKAGNCQTPKDIVTTFEREWAILSCVCASDCVGTCFTVAFTIFRSHIFTRIYPAWMIFRHAYNLKGVIPVWSAGTAVTFYGCRQSGNPLSDFDMWSFDIAKLAPQTDLKEIFTKQKGKIG